MHTTYQILNYAVTPAPSADKDQDRRERRRRIKRVATELGYQSEKYFEKTLKKSGDEYGQTGERNLLDRLELLMRTIQEFCPTGNTLILCWVQTLYNDLMNNPNTPIPHLDMVTALANTMAGLLQPDANAELLLTDLRRVIDQSMGIEITPAPVEISAQITEITDYHAQRQQEINAQLARNRAVREREVAAQKLELEVA